MLRVLSIVAIGIATALVANTAVAVDLHAFWDQRCADCHGHAGDFARRHLEVEKGRLVGRHHRNDLRQFLSRHESGDTQADGIYAMLLAQASTKPVYQQKCTGCHGNAAELARSSLTEIDGRLSGRSSRQPISEFLRQHGKLSPEEAVIVIESLKRVYGEAEGKQPR